MYLKCAYVADTSVRNVDTANFSVVSNVTDTSSFASSLRSSQVRDFFSRMIGAGRGCAYILHGHGSGGVLKGKVREALRREALVERYGPADDEDGGDAFTMVFLKDLL